MFAHNRIVFSIRTRKTRELLISRGRLVTPVPQGVTRFPFVWSIAKVKNLKKTLALVVEASWPRDQIGDRTRNVCPTGGNPCTGPASSRQRWSIALFPFYALFHCPCTDARKLGKRVLFARNFARKRQNVVCPTISLGNTSLNPPPPTHTIAPCPDRKLAVFRLVRVDVTLVPQPVRC